MNGLIEYVRAHTLDRAEIYRCNYGDSSVTYDTREEMIQDMEQNGYTLVQLSPRKFYFVNKAALIDVLIMTNVETTVENGVVTDLYNYRSIWLVFVDDRSGERAHEEIRHLSNEQAYMTYSQLQTFLHKGGQL